MPRAFKRCSAPLTEGMVSRFVIVALLLKCAAPGPTTAATIRPTAQSGATRVLVMRGSPWNIGPPLSSPVLVRGSPEREHESLHARTTRTTTHPQCHGAV